MVKRRPAFQKLSESYLFPEIHRRKNLFLEKNPTANLISLGIGDTVKPLPPYIAGKMERAAASLATSEGYHGYGKEQGLDALRIKICDRFYPDHIDPSEVFISDGAKCDIGRLQMLFGGQVKVAVQDPAYPVYLEGSILQGVDMVTFMPCLPENNFFPDLSALSPHDLIYVCHPNNPTGCAYTHEQLTQLVDYALEHRAIILFDVAYVSFITDPSLPKSIYEIPQAEKVAIEVGSFSKMAGFSGVRLGWTVVPKALEFDEGYPVWKDWMRLNTTIYNGTSFVVQQAGLATLDEEGWREIQAILDIYRANAQKLLTAFQQLGYTVYGGENAPYLWVDFPGRDSWDVFQEFLEKKNLIVTPGNGFGPSGERFIRLSAFAHEEQIDAAINVLQSGGVS
ncbi:LL-diaminopimelate aminotransferase [Simkania negevensis]|uniref:LL-diaminopimelate aminotransferase n=1 Tax=Simkania negevensis (strain ATCC VR-1471 / DSM 27360 / Z) TaxID=331113 RepID=F8L812_SIMNZ|nr:LL-diaminopimelate aminotransferase [Simkania negevensis]MCB1074019.1 LL-diaminopimelate aminotransferase [Simkania sp.]CCB88914.1 LL-diaminopimelate aminotransferase [Simkania negevensis Z]